MSSVIEISDMDSASGSDREIDTQRFDISESDIKRLKIGQYVEVTVCGVVGNLSIPPMGGQPSLHLRVDTRKISIISSAQEKGIRSLSDDTDDEEDSIDLSGGD